ncbi:hypothetical protein MTO96_033680 [Rhipicephalus appendiculatus]
MEALDRCGLGRRIAAIEPVPDSDDWVVKLATLAAAKTLLNKGAIKVKGLCCTVIQTETRKTEIDLQWVPFNLPDAAIRKCARSVVEVAPPTGDAEGSQKVPLEPGDVQAAATAEGDSEEQSVSNQETVPVAEARAAHEPHDVKPDEETDNTSSDDESDSSDDGPPH